MIYGKGDFVHTPSTARQRHCIDTVPDCHWRNTTSCCRDKMLLYNIFRLQQWVTLRRLLEQNRAMRTVGARAEDWHSARDVRAQRKYGRRAARCSVEPLNHSCVIAHPPRTTAALSSTVSRLQSCTGTDSICPHHHRVPAQMSIYIIC